MDPAAEDPGVSRVPTREDLVKLARSLNEAGALYVVAGHGDGRQRVEPYDHGRGSPGGLGARDVAKVSRALAVLPDEASLEVGPRDVQDYVAVQINDETAVDLMEHAGGVAIEWQEIDGGLSPLGPPVCCGRRSARSERRTPWTAASSRR